MTGKDTTALRKRAQIAKANRTMFLWVACASVVVSVSAVLVVMMVQKLSHNQKAINELNKTVSVLRSSNQNVGELEDQVRALGSDESLLELRVNKGDNALRTILDALPAEPNPSALGASLQDKLFEGITVEGVQVMPLSQEGLGADESADSESAASQAGSIEFQFVVQGEAAQLKELLTRLERSIRTIQIAHVKIESSGNRQTLSVRGQAYYQPAKTLELRNMDVQP